MNISAAEFVINILPTLVFTPCSSRKQEQLLMKENEEPNLPAPPQSLGSFYTFDSISSNEVRTHRSDRISNSDLNKAYLNGSVAFIVLCCLIMTTKCDTFDIAESKEYS